MDRHGIERAAALLAAAHRSGDRLDALPAGLSPADAVEAMAVQDAMVRLLGEEVTGWKVAHELDGVVLRGAVLAGRCFASGAAVPAATMPTLGVEAEIAFRFDADAPPREAVYSREEVEAITTPFVAIEIVDSRFTSYDDADFHCRAADLMSNGGLVIGPDLPGAAPADLAALEVTLSLDGEVDFRAAASHPRGEPILPAIDLVNAFRASHGVRKGQVMTTGSFVGLRRARPGQVVEVAFSGPVSGAVSGAATVSFPA